MLLLFTLLLLTACGTAKPTPTTTKSPTPVATKTTYEVPNDCLKITILKSFPSDIKNPKFVDTNWSPAVGTDLAAVYSAGEFHSWYTNLLIDGIWIQVGASYVQSVAQGMPLVKAAIQAIRSAAVAQTTKIIGCYVATLKEDKYILNVTSQENNLITGNIAFMNSNKDSSSGAFKGFYTNGILTGIYNFNSEGMHSKRELLFKGDKTGFNPVLSPL